MPSRRLRTVASLTSTFALVAGGVAATTGVAQAAPGEVDTTLCVGTPIWIGEFDPGQEVYGLTTTTGTEPEEFEGEYVGTLADPFGNDIFLFDLSGSRITKGDGSIDAGIWAGISGSPVYDADDNLIGSVSYSFTQSAGSTIAGVTPAKNIIDTDPDTPAEPAAVRVPGAVQKSLKAKGLAAGPVLRPLTAPRVAVGGPSSPGLTAGETVTKFAAKSRTLTDRHRNKAVTFGDAGIAAAAIDTIEPGGNIAASWTQGDLILASVGTVTAVCGTKVFAFGHPDEEIGESTQSFHSASTATVIADGGNSYKLVNIDPEAAGSLTYDGVNGIVGTLGAAPNGTLVTTSTSGRFPQSHETLVSTDYALSMTVFTQVANELRNAYKKYGAGEALMTWTIGYTPEGGESATYTRTQRVSAGEFFPEEGSYDVASDVEFLQNGSVTPVTIDSVDVSTTMTPDYRAYRISRVDWRQGGKWVKVRNGQAVAAKRGSKMNVLVHLAPTTRASKVTATTKRIELPVSKIGLGRGILNLQGGYGAYDDEEQFAIELSEDEEDYEDYYYEEDLTIEQLVALLKSQPRYDSIVSTQAFNSVYGPFASRRVTSLPAVTSGDFTLRLAYR